MAEGLQQTVTLDGDTLRIGIPFTKIDPVERTVEGIITSEREDLQHEILEYEGSVEAIENWAGNIREMHGRKAVGKRLYHTLYPEERKIGLKAYISRSSDGEDTWTKIQEGILGGFSVGGNPISRVQEKVQKDDGGERTRARTSKWRMSEASIVDNPANPDCVITLVKDADGTVEFGPALADEEVPAPVSPAGKDIEKGSVDVDEDMIADQWDIEKADWPTALKNKAPDAYFAYVVPGGTKDAEDKTVPRKYRKCILKHPETGDYDEAHVKNARARAAQNMDTWGGKAMAKIKSAYSALGLEWEDEKSEKADAPPEAPAETEADPPRREFRKFDAAAFRKRRERERGVIPVATYVLMDKEDLSKIDGLMEALEKSEADVLELDTEQPINLDELANLITGGESEGEEPKEPTGDEGSGKADDASKPEDIRKLVADVVAEAMKPLAETINKIAEQPGPRKHEVKLVERGSKEAADETAPDAEQTRLVKEITGKEDATLEDAMGIVKLWRETGAPLTDMQKVHAEKLVSIAFAREKLEPAGIQRG